MAAVNLELWRSRAVAVCLRRGWSLKWDARLAQHVCEAAELSEALRGKGGDPVEEAGDLLFTALAMIPASVPLWDVICMNFEKMDRLMDSPPYAGEDHTAPEPVRGSGEGKE